LCNCIKVPENVEVSSNIKEVEVQVHSEQTCSAYNFRKRKPVDYRDTPTRKSPKSSPLKEEPQKETTPVQQAPDQFVTPSEQFIGQSC
jgi:hypothetical protein